MGNGEICAAASAQQLLQEFRETGHQALFAEIVRRYAGMVYHVCLQITKNTHDAEDATQAVFLTLAIQSKTGKEIKCIGPWLQQVAYRLSLDLRKAKKRRQLRETKRVEIQPSVVAADQLENLDMDELRHVLTEELNKLPPKYRMPLILHYFGGLSREEMARELGCKPSTLGVRLFRGREMLGHRLAERGVEFTGGVLSLAMAYAVHNAVSDSLVASTCHAAAQIAAGHEVGVGIVSSQVMGLVRGTLSAMALAKFKAIVTVAVLAGSAMAAGAQVVAKVSPLDLRLDFARDLGQYLRLRFYAPPILRSSADGGSQDQPGPSGDLVRPAEDSLVKGYPVFPFDGMACQLPSAEPSPVQITSSLSLGVNAVSPSLAVPNASMHLRPGFVTPIYTNSSFHLAGAAALPASLMTPLPAWRSSAMVLTEPASVPRQSDSAVATRHEASSTTPSKAVPQSPGITLPGFDINAVMIGPSLPLMRDVPQMPVFPSPTRPTPSARNTELASNDSAGLDLVLKPVTPALPEHSTPKGSTGTGLSTSVPSGTGTSPVPIALAHSGIVASTLKEALGQQLITYSVADSAIQSAPLAGPSPVPEGESYSLKTKVVLNAASDAMAEWNSSGTDASAPVMTPSLSSCPWTVDAQVLRGWGKPDISGVFDNSGQVIADGRGGHNTLDLSGIRGLRNSVDNVASGGVNGWFARNGGKLLLGSVPVSPGAKRAVWGEDPADSRIDLVNSVQISLGSVETKGSIQLSLLSPDRTDVPCGPGGRTILSLFSIDSEGIPLNDVGLTIRYDQQQALALGVDERCLQLWRYDGAWHAISDWSFSLDVNHKLISGRADSLSYFAVTTPEPGALLTLVAAAGILLHRRRRCPNQV